MVLLPFVVTVEENKINDYVSGNEEQKKLPAICNPDQKTDAELYRVGDKNYDNLLLFYKLRPFQLGTRPHN